MGLAARAHARSAAARAALTAQNDPRFKQVHTQVRQSSWRLKQHPPAAKKAAEAQAAAKGPANEKLAGAKANQVDKMEGAKGKEPDKGGFLELLRGEIAKVMPQTLDDAENFMKGDEKQQIKGAAGANVSEQKHAAAGPVQQAATAAPDTSGVATKVATEIPAEAPVRPGMPDASNAIPAPIPADQVAQDDCKKDADQQLAEAKLTPKQLQKANDPRFTAVIDAKQDVAAVADASPGKYRAGEKAILAQGVAKATGDTRKGLAVLQGARGHAGVTVKTRQQLAKEKDEAERKKVTDTIEGIYAETKAKVEAKLSSLETDVSDTFDRGIDAALASMQSYANDEIDKYHSDRYSGIRGKARWLVDQFRDAPPGIKRILERARGRFTSEMDALAVSVSSTVDRRLKEAKDEVTNGQKRIDGYVKSLPKNLQTVGKDAQAKVEEKFKDLTQSIDDKADDLAQQLAQKYKDAHDKADSALKEIEKANAGALKKLADKVGEVIKALMEFKDKLMAVLRKGAAAIMDILSDPIGFLGNLIAAVKQGFRQFLSNIGKHLADGFKEWLFGSLASAGIQVPADLNVWSILKLVLDVAGLTTDWIRGEATKLVGARNMAIVEKLLDYVMITIHGGPKALWEKVKEDLSNLKEMVVDAIQTWLMETLVKQAVTKVLSMFNPVGAIVQAVIAIYNLVMWVVENASRILALIEAVVDSVSAIVAGDISGAAKKVEDALASTIPILIAFLARLVGLGGLTDKIRSFIQKVQSKARAAVLGWLKKAWAWIKSVVGKIGGALQRGGSSLSVAIGGRDERTPAEKQADLDLAVREIKPKLQPLLERGARGVMLRARLRLWKTQYKLTDLSIVDGKVRATVNPTADMFSVEEKQLGAALQPLLQEADAAWLASVRQTQASAQRLATASQQMQRGQPLPAGMSRDERIEALRSRPSTAAQLTAPPDYDFAMKQHQDDRLFMASAGGYSPAQLPGMPRPDTRAPEYANLDPREVRQSAARFVWYPSINRRMEEGRGLGPQHEALRDEIEVARSEGNLPANRVAAGLVTLSGQASRPIALAADVTVPGATSTVSVAEMTYGRMAPMATVASAGAGTMGENREAATPQQLARATEVRHGSYAVIFNTLSRAVAENRDALVKLPGHQQVAMADLKRAFDAWKARFQAGKEAGSEANAFRNALLQYMAATRQ